jgi:adenylate cyclase
MQEVRVTRRLTALLLADVVGYSRLMGADEERAHQRLTDYVEGLIEPAVARYRGRLVRSRGDGFLGEFDSAVDAVRCAIDIQQSFAAHPAGDGMEPIRLRIGVNTGDVIVEEQDIYGHSVNIAARLEALAEPGAVYVTGAVRDQLQGYLGFNFEDRGERWVKNIDHPIRVFRVTYAEAESEAAPGRAWRRLPARLRRLYRRLVPPQPRWQAIVGVVLALAVASGIAVQSLWPGGGGPELPRASIVVMPFNNFSGDPSQNYVADAITDDVTTDLARLKGTFVIARNTAFTFKGRSIDARDVGKECGVRYMLEGSIVRIGNRIATNVQLIDTQTGAHVWADRFETDITDLLALQSAVTGRIAAALDIQLTKAEAERAAQHPTADPDAVDLRLRAMALAISGITPERTLEAQHLLEQSVKLDPNAAESWAWLAEILMNEYLHHWNNAGKQQLDEADAASNKALSLDPTNDQAYYAQALVHRAKGEHHAALEAFTRALELNPNLPKALAEKGNELTLLGRPTEAPPLVEKAIRLSPRDPALGGFYWIIGRAHFFSGDYAGAISWLRKSLALRRNDWYIWLYLVSAYALDNQLDEAKKTLREFDSRTQFAGYTLERVNQAEKTGPNDNPVVVAARQKFRQGLQLAGMPAR